MFGRPGAKLLFPFGGNGRFSGRIVNDGSRIGLAKFPAGLVVGTSGLTASEVAIELLSKVEIPETAAPDAGELEPFVPPETPGRVFGRVPPALALPAPGRVPGIVSLGLVVGRVVADSVTSDGRVAGLDV